MLWEAFKRYLEDYLGIFPKRPPAPPPCSRPHSNRAYFEQQRSWYQEILRVISMTEIIPGTHLPCLRNSFLNPKGLRNSIRFRFRSQELILEPYIKQELRDFKTLYWDQALAKEKFLGWLMKSSSLEQWVWMFFGDWSHSRSMCGL